MSSKMIRLVTLLIANLPNSCSKAPESRGLRKAGERHSWVNEPREIFTKRRAVQWLLPLH